MGGAEGNYAKGEGKGTGRAAFKGIVFVEQVALTYPLAHLINQHFSKSSSRGSGMNGDSQCATCLKPKAAVEFEEPTALPVSGTGSMVDAVRYTTLHLALLDSSTLHLSQADTHSFESWLYSYGTSPISNYMMSGRQTGWQSISQCIIHSAYPASLNTQYSTCPLLSAVHSSTRSFIHLSYSRSLLLYYTLGTRTWIPSVTARARYSYPPQPSKRALMCRTAPSLYGLTPSPPLNPTYKVRDLMFVRVCVCDCLCV